MKTGKQIFVFTMLAVLLSAGAAHAAVPGDVTGDDAVNVADVQCAVLAALKPDPPPCLGSEDSADLNCDAAVNVVDVQLSVLIVLKHPQPGVPEANDENGNNIHDDCEDPGGDVCGDGDCTGDENCTTCSEDCGSCCGNDICDWDESCESCEADCGVCGDFVAGDIIITEILKDPKAVDDQYGEWFEIRNMQPFAVDLKDWTIKDDGTDVHVINQSLDLQGNANLIFGRNSNKSLNCNVDVDYQYSNFTLGNGADEIILVAPDGVTVVDEVAYNDNDFPDVAGKAMSLSSLAYDYLENDDGENWCLATTMIPGCADWGCPGIVNPKCQDAICGNGQVEPGEQCEPPNQGNCDENCQIKDDTVCGNQILEAGEDCDDGCLSGTPNVCEQGIDDGDGCSYLCKSEKECVCGNDIVENAQTGKPNCSEECDDGNWDNGDGCDWECKLEAVCGNGVVEPGEQCEPPNEGNCNADCIIIGDPECGNGIKEGTEQCDDGNLIPNDGCDENCEIECENPPCVGMECGNGIVEEENDEECDDGNTENGDGCNDSCKFEDPCPGACCPSPCCGDGTTDPGEECDDMNDADGDGCSSDCKFEVVELQGIKGTVTYDGTPAPNDVLRMHAYDKEVTDWMEAGQPAGAGEEKNPIKNQDYKIDLTGKPAGAYWVVAHWDVGGNNSQDIGDEDSGAVYDAVVQVQKDQFTNNINFSVPEGGDPGGGASISGTVSLSGQISPNPSKDVLKLMLSTQPQGMPSKTVTVKPLPSFPYDYTIEGVSPGSWYVIGMFDKNGDSNGPPKAGDWLGIYQSMANKKKVQVQKDQQVTGKDFTIDTKQ